MKLTKKKFMSNVLGVQLIDNNKRFVVYYRPPSKGGSFKADMVSPFVIGFIGHVTTQLLYDVGKLARNLANETNKNKTNRAIVKQYLKDNYGSAQRALKKLLVYPAMTGAVATFAWNKLKTNPPPDRFVEATVPVMKDTVKAGYDRNNTPEIVDVFDDDFPTIARPKSDYEFSLFESDDDANTKRYAVDSVVPPLIGSDYGNDDVIQFDDVDVFDDIYNDGLYGFDDYAAASVPIAAKAASPLFGFVPLGDDSSEFRSRIKNAVDVKEVLYYFSKVPGGRWVNTKDNGKVHTLDEFKKYVLNRRRAGRLKLTKSFTESLKE